MKTLTQPARIAFFLLCLALIVPGQLYARMEAPRTPLADNQAPTSAATSPAYANSSPITVSYTASDDDSGVALVTLWYRYEDGSWTETTYTDTLEVSSFAFVPGDGEGTYDFQTIAVDVATNVESLNTDPDDSTVYDTAAPTSPSVVVNAGATYATQITVTLTLSAADATSGVATMEFSNDGTNWSTPRAYATSAQWTLDGSADGLKTVQARFYDAAGNPSTIASDTITLDRLAPTSPSIVIDSGAQYATQLPVTLTLSAQDATSGLAEMSFSNNGTTFAGWVPYATTYPDWNLSAVDGTRTVYARFRDNAGLISSNASDTIILDRVAPTGTSVSINGGAAYTNQTAVTLTLAATDATSGMGEMRFNNTLVDWGAWQAFATSAAWTLDGASDGLKTVYAEFQDNAGNAAAIVNDQITLDRQAPTGLTISSPAFITETSFLVSWSASDANTILYSVDYQVDGGSWTNWVVDSTDTSRTFSLAQTGHTYLFQVTAEDPAGNTAGPEQSATRVGYYYLYLPIALRNYDPLSNGSFERGLEGWTVLQSPLPVSLVTAVAERPSGTTAPSDGASAILLGKTDYACTYNGVPLGYAGVEQTVTVPQDATFLRFDYVIYTQDAMPAVDPEYFDRFEVYINNTVAFADGNEVNLLYCSTWRRVPGPENLRDGQSTGWATGSIDMTAYRGQRVTIRLRNYSRYDGWFNTYTYIDNVRILTLP